MVQYGRPLHQTHVFGVGGQKLVICCLNTHKKMKETTRLLYKNAIQIEHKFRRSLNNTRQLPPGAQLKDVKGQKPNHGGF